MQPLPLYQSEHLGEITTDGGEKLTITFGLSAEAVEAFRARSCDREDSELQRFTSDYKRICENGYESWYAKGRYPYALLNDKNELAGLIWFGPKPFPIQNPTLRVGLGPSTLTNPTLRVGLEWQTFAIRMYVPYRGKRLALPFAEFVFAKHAETFPGVPIWLDTDTENIGAIRLYQKLGFVECGQNEDGRVVMKKI